MIDYILIEGKPQPDVLAGIELLYAELFGSIDQEKFYRRTNGDQKMFTILACDGDELIGFKIGYALDETIFYSWIGGVKATYRRTGIARQLMHQQHRWCREAGYQMVRTKTMNRWKPMLILNLENGFDIKSTYIDEKGELKILLEKRLV